MMRRVYLIAALAMMVACSKDDLDNGGNTSPVTPPVDPPKEVTSVGRVILYEDFNSGQGAIQHFAMGGGSENANTLAVVDDPNDGDNMMLSVTPGVKYATMTSDYVSKKNKAVKLSFDYCRTEVSSYNDRIDIGGDEGKIMMYISGNKVSLNLATTGQDRVDLTPVVDLDIQAGVVYNFAVEFDPSSMKLEFLVDGESKASYGVAVGTITPTLFSTVGVTNYSSTPFLIDNVCLQDWNLVEVDVLAFALPHQYGPATIDAKSGTISIKVYKNSNKKGVKPFFRCSNATTLSPSMDTPIDLDAAPLYTVTSFDSKESKSWTVNISECPFEEPSVLRVTAEDGYVGSSPDVYLENGIQMSLTINNSPTVEVVDGGRKGQKCLKFMSGTAEPGTGDNKQRIEVRLGGEITKDPVEDDIYPNEDAWDWQLSEGAERYFGMSFKMDPSFEYNAANEYTDLFQVKQSGSRDEGGNAWIAFGPKLTEVGGCQEGEFELWWRYGQDMNHYSSDLIDIGMLEKDVWYDFVFGFRFAKLKNDGFMRVYMKKSTESEYTLIEKKNIKNGYADNTSAILTTQCGIYRARTENKMTIYYDEIRIARTFEEARIQD